MVCRFVNVKYTIINGNIKSIKNTNIAMVKPHIVKIKDINYLVFDDCNDSNIPYDECLNIYTST